MRVSGQIGDGTFAANASRTLAGTMDEVLEKWTAYMAKFDQLNGVSMTEPATTTPPRTPLSTTRLRLTDSCCGFLTIREGVGWSGVGWGGA